MAELLTPLQKERRIRDGKIAAEFVEMMKKYPNASQSLIMKEMATRCTHGLSSTSGIRSALIRTGTIRE